MLQKIAKFAIFQQLQLDNLVDFEKCCKTHTLLQKSVPIQPKTSNILPQPLVRELQVPLLGDGERGEAEACEPGNCLRSLPRSTNDLAKL